jgi:hypothetical protein
MAMFYTKLGDCSRKKSKDVLTFSEAFEKSFFVLNKEGFADTLHLPLVSLPTLHWILRPPIREGLLDENDGSLYSRNSGSSFTAFRALCYWLKL